MREGLESGLLLPGGEVELARGAVHDVSCNDAVNLVAERLDRDCDEEERMRVSGLIPSFLYRFVFVTYMGPWHPRFGMPRWLASCRMQK